MSDVSDPEDEIVDVTPTPKPAAQSGQCSGDHGHAHAHPSRMKRVPVKPPPGSDRWPAIYPIYINKNRTRQQGRRIAKENAVENPVFWEIRDVLDDAGFKYWIEDKVHPREPDRFGPIGPASRGGNPFRGRIKFKLHDEQKKPAIEKFPTKESVYIYLGRMIPKLKQRIEGHKMEQQMRIQQEQIEQEVSKATKSAPGKKTKKPVKKKGRR